jgi:hypothetical protein
MVHYRVQKNPPQAPILKHMNQVDSKGIWRWCITLRITGFWTLSIVQYSKRKINYLEYRTMNKVKKSSNSEHINQVHNLPPYSFKVNFNISLVSTPMIYQVVSFLNVFRLKCCIHISAVSYVLHAHTSHLTWISHPNLVNITFDIPHFVIFFSLLLLSLSLVRPNILAGTRHSQSLFFHRKSWLKR